MKNQLFNLKAVQTGTHKAEVGARAGSGNLLKIGARAETNSFGSTTLFSTVVFPGKNKFFLQNLIENYGTIPNSQMVNKFAKIKDKNCLLYIRFQCNIAHPNILSQM
jgi:hypothetical protein